MKTRAQIYDAEASTLFRDITLYHCVKSNQLKMLYPAKDSKIENLLQYFMKQGRIFYDSKTDTYYDNAEMKSDPEMLAALWVLSDFGDKVEYHSTDVFPVKIIFFADGEIYEIIYVARDKEAIIFHILSSRKNGINGKQILIVDDQKQIEDIDVPDVIFCTVDNGCVQYYKKEQE